MKKILSICLSIVIALLPLSAFAEMITITVPAATLIDQSFAGTLTEAPSGWTLAGTLDTTYKFGENGIRATNYKGFTIYNNEVFNADKADYTFSVKFAHNGGTSYLHFGAETATDAIAKGVSVTGYTLKIERTSDYKSGIYTMYKNGVEIGALADTNTSYGFQKNRTYTFKVTSESITVTGAGDTFTYEDAEPVKNGYVGMRLIDTNGNYGNLASISLKTDEYSYEIEKPAEVITGAYVTYEKPGVAYMDYDLRGATSVPEGVTPASGYTLGTSGLSWTGYPNNTTKFGTATVPSDITKFTIESRYKALYDGSPKFNFLGYTLEKTGKHDKDKTFTLKKGSETLGTYVWTYESTSDFVDGTVLVKISFNDSKITVTVNDRDIFTDVEDTEVSKTGAVSLVSGYVGEWTIGSVKIASPATNVTKSSFLMDKTFSADDTTAGLSADGYSVSGVNEYVTGKGMVRTEEDYTLSAFYNGAVFSGAYTLEVVAAKDRNKGTVYFNRADSSNHYSVSTKSGSSSAGTLWIQKTVGGTATSLLKDDEGTTVDSLSIDIGTNDELKYTISLEPLDTGDMQITVKLTNYAGYVRTYTVIDKKTDTNEPFTSGKIGHSQSYAGTDNNRIKSFKVYPTPTDGAEAAKYTGSFNVNGADAAELTKGITLFKFPVAMIGQTPDFIAALYEDYEMTDVKLVDVYDMNEGITELFDTTDSTADNISISLFVWNELEGLVSVLDTYVLE